MKKMLFFLVAILYLQSSTIRVLAQGFGLVIHFNKNIDSIYYKNRTIWLAPTPILFTKQTFSMDKGKNYMRAGLLGSKLNPYVANIPEAKRSLRTFKALRLVGLAQMLILAPIFFGKEIAWTNDYNRKYSPPYPDIKSPGYIGYSIGFLCTGSITYHLISKPFFRKTLRRYHKTNTLN